MARPARIASWYDGTVGTGTRRRRGAAFTGSSRRQEGSAVRFVSSSFGRFLALVALLLACGAARAEAAPAWDREALRSVARAPGVRVVTSSRAGSPVETVDALERAGYHVDVAVMPDLFFVRPRARAARLPAGLADATPPATARAPSDAPFDPFEGRADALPPVPRPSRALAPRGDGLTAGVRLPRGLPSGARWTDTSEF